MFFLIIFSPLLIYPTSDLSFIFTEHMTFWTVSFQRKHTLPDQRRIFKRKMLAMSWRHTQAINVPILHQDNLVLFKIILFYLKPMYSWTTFYSHISVVYFISSGNYMDGDSIALQGKVEQGWHCKVIFSHKGSEINLDGGIASKPKVKKPKQLLR